MAHRVDCGGQRLEDQGEESRLQLGWQRCPGVRQVLLVDLPVPRDLDLRSVGGEEPYVGVLRCQRRFSSARWDCPRHGSRDRRSAPKLREPPGAVEAHAGGALLARGWTRSRGQTNGGLSDGRDQQSRWFMVAVIWSTRLGDSLEVGSRQHGKGKVRPLRRGLRLILLVHAAGASVFGK
jgi:hypothetical protein